MVSRALILFSVCCLSALKLAGAGSAPDKLNGLLENSPFGVSRANAAAGSSASDPLEFRSVLEEKGRKFFSIYETAVHRSIWVELNDPVNGFSIKGYDAAHDNITVEYHNKTLTLPQKRAAAVAQASPLVSAGMPPGIASAPGVASPSDSQRLQQIQEEIRRRRALRQPSLVPTPLPPGAQPGPQPMLSSTPGAQSGPLPMPGTAGAQSGPQPTPLPPGSQPGPQPIPSNSSGSSSGPQFPQFSPSNSSGPQPMPAKP